MNADDDDDDRITQPGITGLRLEAPKLSKVIVLEHYKSFWFDHYEERVSTLWAAGTDGLKYPLALYPSEHCSDVLLAIAEAYYNDMPTFGITGELE